MKRSKLFLGLTTCLLAVAGLVAAKASKHTVTAKIYTSAQNLRCVEYGSALNATTTPSSNILKTSAQLVKTLYTANSACLHRFYQGI
jgi:hypothetical protein